MKSKLLRLRAVAPVCLSSQPALLPCSWFYVTQPLPRLHTNRAHSTPEASDPEVISAKDTFFCLLTSLPHGHLSDLNFHVTSSESFFLAVHSFNPPHFHSLQPEGILFTLAGVSSLFLYKNRIFLRTRTLTQQCVPSADDEA